MRKISLILFLILIMPSLHAQQKKTTVAVLEFQSGGTLEKSEAYTLSNRFRALLVTTRTFQVIEREKMNEILKAQDYNISDACNTAECAVQVGQLLGVESMIAGDIGKLGETYTIDLRMIDVQTGGLIQSQSQNHKGKIDGLLDVMQTMANALAEAAEGRTTAKLCRVSITASIPISAVTQKIDILTDGNKVGENSVDLFLHAGQHKIVATTHHADFTEYNEEITLVADQKFDIKLDYSEAYRKRMAEITANNLDKKRYGGASNALLSVLFPGLGGYFVEKNKLRPLAATVSTAALIIYGVTQKNRSNKYYSDYKVSLDRDEMNAFYRKANNAHHRYYIATRIGGAIWISDIVWVAYKGARNNRSIKSAGNSSPGRGLALNHDGYRLQLEYTVNF